MCLMQASILKFIKMKLISLAVQNYFSKLCNSKLVMKSKSLALARNQFSNTGANPSKRVLIM
jgi:hypothetical protein